MMQSRLATFVANLPEREVDAILVSGAENQRYPSGSAGYLFITDAGYDENFGHGVGLAVHEMPRVSPRSEDPLDVNSVFPVEPGSTSPDGAACTSRTSSSSARMEQLP